MHMDSLHMHVFLNSNVVKHVPLHISLAYILHNIVATYVRTYGGMFMYKLQYFAAEWFFPYKCNPSQKRVKSSVIRVKLVMKQTIILSKLSHKDT